MGRLGRKMRIGAPMPFRLTNYETYVDPGQPTKTFSTLSVSRFIRRNLTVLVLWLLNGQAAFAQSCLVDARRYNLRDDIVTWSMTMASGHSCVRGVRFSNVQFESLKLTSPPKFGQVILQGSGFIYSPKADFNGQDSFSIEVFGAIDRKRGSSTIQVTVSVNPTGIRDTPPPLEGKVTAKISPSNTADTTPPSVFFAAPSDNATVSGSAVALTATASDDVAVASVQFIVGGKNIGSAVTSPPYATVWDSTRLADGSYTLYAVARDTSGNYGTSSIHVTVKNN
jgi:hypothetical protein